MDTLRYFNLNESYPYVNGIHYNGAFSIIDGGSSCYITILDTETSRLQPYHYGVLIFIYPSFSGYYTVSIQGYTNMCCYFVQGDSDAATMFKFANNNHYLVLRNFKTF